MSNEQPDKLSPKEKLVELLFTFNPKSRAGCHYCGSHVNFEPSEPKEVELLADKILVSLMKSKFTIKLEELKDTLKVAEEGIEKGDTGMIFLIHDNINNGNRPVHVQLENGG